MKTTPTLSAEAVADYIEKQAERLLAQRALVRKERASGTHDMRVASRRLRVALREAAPLLEPAQRGRVMDGLSTVTRALGHVRELDVMLLMMEEYAKDAYGPWKRAAEHAISEIRGVRREASHGCAEAVQTLEQPEFETDLRAIVQTLRAAKGQALDAGAAGLKKRLGRFRKDYRDWRESEQEEQLHRARISCKKLRYAAEFYAPAYDKRMREFIDTLKMAQEMLGDWHDAHMLCDALRRIERHAPYREVQGFPLIIEAFHAFGEAKTQEFQAWARAFFDKARREEAVSLFQGA